MEYEHKLNTKLIKQSKPNKITIIAEIKWQRLREERCKHKDNTAMCYRRGNQSPWRKISPPSSKWSIIHWRMKLGYMNSRRSSKPNLPNVPKPSKLLAPMRLRRTFVFSNLPDSAMAHSINQYQLVPSYLLLKYQTASSHIWVWWEKVLVKCTSQGCINGEVESRGIWRIKGWRLWMSQSCFSLGFLSQNSL